MNTDTFKPMGPYITTGLDPMKQNQSNVDRPIRLADPVAKPVTEVLG